MDDMFNLTMEPAKRLAPEDLQSLGKRASLMFTDQGIPLNEAVVKLAQENPHITSEQVKRVVEYANQHTFQDAFAKQAGDKNIDFIIADPHVVLRHLDNMVSPPIVKAASDYHRPPIDIRDTRAEDAELESLFSKAAESEPLEKTASDLDMTKVAEHNPHGDLHAAWETLKKSDQILGDSLRTNSFLMKEAQDAFHHDLRQHLLEGGDLTEVAEVMAGLSNEKVAAAALDEFEPELRKLAHTGRIDLHKIQASSVSRDLFKTAALKHVDPEHPVVNSYYAFIKIANKQAELETAYDEVQGQLKEAEDLVKESFLGTVAKAGGKALLNAAKSGGKAAVKATGSTAEKAIKSPLKTTGTVLGADIIYSGFKKGTKAGKPFQANPFKT